MKSELGERDIWLVDTTLRDGEQAPGVTFSRDEKVSIAKALSAAGVPEIEAGIPVMGAEEQATIRAISSAVENCRVTCWCRLNELDIEAAQLCETGAIHLSVPASDIQLASMGRDRSWAVNTLRSLLPLARKSFDFVSIGLLDASRAENEFLMELCEIAEGEGVDRLRMADTVGVWSPFKTQTVFASLKEKFPNLQLGIHAHNDLGMATANTLGAIEGGATCADVTVCGLGERTGNAALEEIIMAASLTRQWNCGVDTWQLSSLTQKVMLAAGRRIPCNKPVVGQDAFRHESGIHCRALLADRSTYEPYPPEVVGRGKSEIVLGKHSGSASVRHAMSTLGFNLSEEDTDVLLKKLQRVSTLKKRELRPTELRALYLRRSAS